jgi:hypothetical protein
LFDTSVVHVILPHRHIHEHSCTWFQAWFVTKVRSFPHSSAINITVISSPSTYAKQAEEDWQGRKTTWNLPPSPSPMFQTTERSCRQSYGTGSRG